MSHTQAIKYCSSNESACLDTVVSTSSGCLISCTGLHADVQHVDQDLLIDTQGDLFRLEEEYNVLRNKFAKNIGFNNSSPNLSILPTSKILNETILSGTQKRIKLNFVEVHFDTATYDEIERDMKMTIEGQLGAIGGTMGLLTGFSILSGIELLYFATRLILAIRIRE